MEEPQRIGLTKEANTQLDEMLETLNTETEGEGLIKIDLYRLAVALGVKNGQKPAPLKEKADGTLRVGEVDPEKALFVAVEASSLADNEEPIYRAVERLAEHGIRKFYTEFKDNMDSLPWDKILA